MSRTTSAATSALLAGLTTLLLNPGDTRADGPPGPKKVALIAGTKSHGPGDHEYEKGMRLLKACLETSPDARGIVAEVHTDGWPDDPGALDDVDTIVLFTDGSDHDEQAHPLLRDDHLAALGRLMEEGVGLVAIHYTVFVPSERAGDRFLDWIGGYFDYQNGDAPNHWYSKIQNVYAPCVPGAPGHPISRGLSPFELAEEYYYNIRFRPDDPRRVPILNAAIPGEPQPQTVAWAVERADGGRGFGFTGGHYHANWAIDPVRRMVLNAILWTAHAEVPEGGVDSDVPAEAFLLDEPTRKDAGDGDETIDTLIVTGPQHPAHDWRATTVALRDVLGRDPRVRVTVSEGLPILGSESLKKYDLIVLNTMNWKRPGLSEEARANFLGAIRGGANLAVIHFANGAFPDWPEYRELARRVWVEGRSNHDPHGPFRVEITGVEHPITKGMPPFDTVDELYFDQEGDLPIEPLATARSKVSGWDAPLAFAYQYGEGRIFQTLLGHDAAAIRNPGASSLILRGCLWASGHDPGPVEVGEGASALAPGGRFGGALDPSRASTAAAPRGEYQEPPLTVECWARIDSKEQFNILVAHTLKDSSTHWEIYTASGNGAFQAYLPGRFPQVIDSKVDIADGQWHHLAMIYEPRRARLLIDAKTVADVAVSPLFGSPREGPVWFGAYPPGPLGCAGLVDEVRISKGVRAIEAVPGAPFEADEATVGLWHFDSIEDGAFADASTRANPAVVGASFTFETPRAGPSGEGPVDYKVADPSLKVVLLDRSPDESLLSVRADTAGRLFVGGREGLFVYEPDPSVPVGYGPPRLLYRFPADSWVTDIEILGDDLYVMTMSAIYVIPSGRTGWEDLQPRRLVWGMPLDLHVSFHGLAWGPQGDLYYATGDPLLNYGDFDNRPDHWGHWTLFVGPDGARIPYTGQGGVFRMRPDGRGWRELARGTRGADGLAFDRRWELYTNDNDHESRAAEYSPARLLHVTPHADFAWPRGWIASKSPDRADLLEPLTTGMGREAPVGQAYYDEDFLPGEYRDSLLVARWGQRRVDRFSLSPRGASYQAEEHPLLVGEGTARPVGVAVGRGGRIFAVISYMQQNEGSPRYVSDLVMITRADDPEGSPFEGYDAATAVPARLWAELSDPSWSRRIAAHQEILRRGGGLLVEAVERLARVAPDDPARNHLPWLAAAGGRPEAAEALLRLASGPDAGDRLQAIRALAEFPALGAPRDLFVKALEDADSRNQLAAIAALFDRPGPLPDALIRGPARDEDTYLRQAASFLVAEQATLDDLASLCRSADAATRRAGVLAVGNRLTVPRATEPPPLELPLRYESENAHFTITYADETIDLHDLGRVGSYAIAERWALGQRTAEERRLFDLLVSRLADVAEPVRLQASYYLSLLNDPLAEPLVAAVRSESASRRLAEAPSLPVERAWFLGPLSDEELGASSARPEDGPIDLSAESPTADGPRAWTTLDARDGFDLAALPGSRGAASSYYLYFRLQSDAAVSARLRVEPDDGLRVWHNGRPVDVVNGLSLELQPGSNDVLIRANFGDEAKPALEYRAPGRVVAVLPEKLGLATLAERLRTASAGGDAASIAQEFLAADWSRALAEGDPDRGRKLFGSDGIGCVKCHAIAPGQAVAGGPSLTDASKRFTVAHVVESVLLPSKQVAPIYRASTIATTDGQVRTGLVVSETDDALELLLSDATRLRIPRQEVEERALQETSPMPTGLVQTPDELRDLLAYILSDRPEAP